MNNGHTLVVSFPDKVYSVSGGGLTGEFNTVQFHLHWGSTNMKGSEHFLDGKQYAAEVSDVKNNRWWSLRVKGVKLRHFELFGPSTKSA